MDAASDDQSQYLSSLACQIVIIQAKNVALKSHGNLFIRYYLSAGNNKKIQLNSQEISSKSNLLWNQSFSLECSGTEQSINNLKQESIVFELRWRSTKPMFGKIIGGSQLLGRAEVPWKTVLDSPDMEMKKWVVMVPGAKKGSCVPHDIDLKPPSVQITIKVGVPATVKREKQKKRSSRLKKPDDCGCCNDGGHGCEHYEIFALAAAFEAF